MPFRSLYGAMAEQRAHFIDGYALGLRLHRDQRVRHDVAVLHDAPRRHVNRRRDAVSSPVLAVVFALRYTYLWAREVIKAKPDYFDSNRP